MSTSFDEARFKGLISGNPAALRYFREYFCLPVRAMLNARLASRGGSLVEEILDLALRELGNAELEDTKRLPSFVCGITRKVVNDLTSACNATGGDTMKGNVKMKMTVTGHEMNSTLDMSGKWISADCGSVK